MKNPKLPLDNSVLNLLLVFSVLCILFILFFSKFIPLYFYGGQKLEDIFLNLSLAIISSYIFYSIVVHRKLRKDNENINVFLGKLVQNLLIEYENYLNVLDERLKSISPLDEKEVQDICLSIRLNEESTMIYNPDSPKLMSFKMFIYYSLITQKRLAQDIYVLMPFLDSTFVRVLSDITTSKLYSKIELFNPEIQNMTNENLVGFRQSIYELHLSFVSLNTYYKKNLKPK